MLSFFSKKKQSNESTPEEIIQGPADPQQQNNGADDFIFINRKPADDPGKNNIQIVYSEVPLLPAYSTVPYPPIAGNRFTNTNAQIPYLQDVPFVLSPLLCIKNIFEGTQMAVDGILAYMTRQLSIEENADDYDFSLERMVQSECY